jgi:hypothetical protein
VDSFVLTALMFSATAVEGPTGIDGMGLQKASFRTQLRVRHDAAAPATP